MHFFDLHCDTVTVAREKGLPLFQQNLQLDFARLPKDVHLAETFAIFIPDELRGEAATAYFKSCADYFRVQLAQNAELVLPVAPGQAVEQIWNKDKNAALLSVEGGAALAGSLDNVSLLRDYAVRMLTLTWNGANEIGGGAGTQGGLTAFGRELLPLLEESAIVIDTSHLNDETFWEVVRYTKRPLVATHSNSRALCGVPRNLTDDAFRAIAERGGLVGLNFYPAFLSDTPQSASISDILRHAEHFLRLGGEDTLALGSDFDGADMPSDLPNANALPVLRLQLEAAFGKTLAEKICYKNTLDFYQCIDAK